MDTKFPALQVTSFISVASVDYSTKFEVYTPSDSNATTQYASVAMVTRFHSNLQHHGSLLV